MKLSILDRIILLQVLPQEGNYLTYKITTELKSNLSFSEEEIKLYNIRTENDKVLWNVEAAVEKEITIGEKANEIIIEALGKLDSEGKINSLTIGTYEKFIKEI